MPTIDSPVNLNIPETPKGVPESLFGEFMRVYNALHNILAYVGQIATSITTLTGHRGSATLVAGVAVVANTDVAAGSLIFLTPQVLGTVAAPKAVAITARVPGVSFTITSADNTDTSVIAWQFR